VESFVYFGTVVNTDGGVMMEIKARLGAPNKCCFGLINPRSSKLLSCSVKCLIYITLVRPVLTFALRRGQWVNKVISASDSLRGKFYKKYLASCLKVDVGGGTKTVK
jgi:hypothetical protein